jgi:esterase/lipase superfamily enzyme
MAATKRMLIFTNRAIENRGDESAFTARYEPAADRLGFAHVERAGNGAWQVKDIHADASDDEIVVELLAAFGGPRPLLVQLHGNNNTPASCFARTELFESLYDVEAIGFSWTSEGYLPDGSKLVGLAEESSGDETDLKAVHADNRITGVIQDKIQRYQQAKINAKNSIDALARLFRLLGTARLAANAQPFSVAAHSLGAHFLQNTLAVAGATESLGTAHNVALLAPCVRAAGHREWLHRLHPAGQVVVTFNNADLVLAGAFFADNKETKLGANPGTELLETRTTRYIDFTGARNDAAQHNYFVRSGMSAQTRKILGRVFASEADIQPGELPRKIYPVGCDERRLTCFMAAPAVRDG